MKLVKRIELNDNQKEQIFKLWNNEYPEKIAYNSLDDFRNYLNNLTEQSHYLLMDGEKETIGWATTFTRDNERWFAIIISERFHGKGIGRKMLNKLKEDEKSLNAWVIDHNTDEKLDGNIYKSPLEFYIKNGFKIMSETRLELEIMSAVKIKWMK